MLTNEDIEFIKRTREEIIFNRLRPLKIKYRAVSKRNPITGVVESSLITKDVKAVVTDITSKAVEERYLFEQANVVSGDIWFSISVNELKDIDVIKIEEVTHNNDIYKVVSIDPKGLGEYNRFEFVGKKVI